MGYCPKENFLCAVMKRFSYKAVSLFEKGRKKRQSNYRERIMAYRTKYNPNFSEMV